LPAAAQEAAGATKTEGLLQRLGLADDSVVNVIMTRDIVPRAFVCDYTLVADVLKRWVPSFKEHGGLAACKEQKVWEGGGARPAHNRGVTLDGCPEGLSHCGV